MLVPVTISDVANMAGVSIKTVSRVANQSPHVRPETREKVQNIIDRLNYRPNPVAVRLGRMNKGRSRPAPSLA